MAIPKALVEVLNNNKLTPKVYEIKFKMVDPAELKFLAGQHFIIEIDDRTVRQYSIATAPSQTAEFGLCADVEPMGPGSKFLLGLKPGDQVYCRGPWGRFILAPKLSGHQIFVATGVGITPLKSMIFDLYDKGFKGKVDLYFGVRHEGDVFYKEFFEELAQKWPNFNFYITLSQPSTRWRGLEGRVTDHLAKADFRDADAYLCGSGQMIEDCRQLLLKNGLPADRIYFEKFFE